MLPLLLLVLSHTVFKKQLLHLEYMRGVDSHFGHGVELLIRSHRSRSCPLRRLSVLLLLLLLPREEERVREVEGRLHARDQQPVVALRDLSLQKDVMRMNA